MITTKKELIQALKPFDDDQFICVLRHLKADRGKEQLLIQEIKEFEPWHPPRDKKIIGIRVHELNNKI